MDIEIIKLLSNSHQQMLSLVDIAKMTSFTIEDIMETLKLLDLLKYYNGQYILTVPQNLLELSKPVYLLEWMNDGIEKSRTCCLSILYSLETITCKR